MIPILCFVRGDQILIRDDIGSCQSLGNFQPTTKAPHIGYYLMGGGIAFMRSKDRNASTSQCRSKRLRIAHNLRGIVMAVLLHFADGNN